MSTTEHAVDVDVDVRTAYDQWTQFEDFPKFMEGVESVTQKDDTHLHWVVEIAGVTREFDTEITEQTPDQRIAWQSLDGPRHAGVVTFHRLDAGRTRVTLQMDVDPQGVTETVGDKAGFISSRTKGDMKRFKDFIETRGGNETGAWRGEVRQTPKA